MDDIQKLKEKIQKDPSSTLFVPLAEIYRKEHRFDEAVEVLTAGIARQPGYMSARVALGKIYLEMEKPAEAREEFEKVISEIPDNLFAHKKLAEALKLLGKREEALVQYDRVLKLNPLDEETLLAVKTMHEDPTIGQSPILGAQDEGAEQETLEEAASDGLDQTQQLDQSKDDWAPSFDDIVEGIQPGEDSFKDEDELEFDSTQRIDISDDDDAVSPGFDMGDDSGGSEGSSEAEEEDGFEKTQLLNANEIIKSDASLSSKDVDNLLNEMKNKTASFSIRPDEGRPDEGEKEAADASSQEDPNPFDAEETAADVDEDSDGMKDFMSEPLEFEEDIFAGAAKDESREPDPIDAAEEVAEAVEVLEDESESSSEPLEFNADVFAEAEVLSRDNEPDPFEADEEAAGALGDPEGSGVFEAGAQGEDISFSLMEADAAVAGEDYDRAIEIYDGLLTKDPENRDVHQRALELRSLLKLLGREDQLAESRLTDFLEGIRKRRDEFFGST